MEFLSDCSERVKADAAKIQYCVEKLSNSLQGLPPEQNSWYFRLRGAALPQVVPLLGKRRSSFLVYSLAKLAPDSERPLINALSSGNEMQKEHAALALSMIKPTTPEIIAALEKTHEGGTMKGIVLNASVESALKQIGTDEARQALERIKKRSSSASSQSTLSPRKNPADGS